MRTLPFAAVLVGCASVPARHTTPRPLATLDRLPAAPCAAQLHVADARKFLGPTKPTARWVHAVHGDWVYGLAADAAGGVVYANGGGVVALDDHGALRWQHGMLMSPRTVPAFGQDGGSYVHVIDDRPRSLNEADWNRGGVLRLDACGAPTWLFHASPRNGKTPAISTDGTVYVAGWDGRSGPDVVFAVHADGTEAWRHQLASDDAVTTPLLAAADGGVAYGTAKGAVVALDATGTERWATAPIPGQIVWNAARGPDGTIYAMYDGTFVAIDTAGHTLWQQQLGKGAMPTPAFGADGTIYVGGEMLRALRPDGTRVWQLDLHGPAGTPVVARDGTVFVPSLDLHSHEAGRVHAIAPSGELLWSYFVETPNALTLGDGILYVAANRRVYALGQCPRDACEDDGTALAALGEPAPRAPGPMVDSGEPAKPAPARAEHHEGYTVYPDCRASTTAVVTTTGEPFTWLTRWGSTAKADVEREEFRAAAVAAAGPIAAHGSGFGVACVDRAAFLIMVMPGEDVAGAARRIGEWLVKTGQRGEIDIEATEPPHNL